MLEYELTREQFNKLWLEYIEFREGLDYREQKYSNFLDLKYNACQIGMTMTFNTEKDLTVFLLKI